MKIIRKMLRYTKRKKRKKKNKTTTKKSMLAVSMKCDISYTFRNCSFIFNSIWLWLNFFCTYFSLFVLSACNFFFLLIFLRLIHSLLMYKYISFALYALMTTCFNQCKSCGLLTFHIYNLLVFCKNKNNNVLSTTATKTT